MPSGAKKRKAARRKQQQQQATGIHHPPPDSTPQGNGGVHDDDPTSHDEGSDHHLTTDDEPEEEEEEDPPGPRIAVAHSTDSPERAEAAMETKEEETVHEVILYSPPPSAIPISKTEAVSVEFVEFIHSNEGDPTEIGSEKPAAAKASLIPITQSDPATEEVIQATEAMAVTSEVVVDAPHHEGEVKEVPLVGAAVERPRDAENPESAASTEVTPTPPRIVHRTAWWNCCGLFDVLTGSQR